MDIQARVTIKFSECNKVLSEMLRQKSLARSTMMTFFDSFEVNKVSLSFVLLFSIVFECNFFFRTKGKGSIQTQTCHGKCWMDVPLSFHNDLVATKFLETILNLSYKKFASLLNIFLHNKSCDLFGIDAMIVCSLHFYTRDK